MTRTAKSPARLFALTILTVYAAILVLSAWPPSLRPTAFDGLTHAASTILARARLSPGQAVFLGVMPGEWKIRAWCPTIAGRLADGSWHALYRPTDQCFWDGVRWAPDRFYVTFQSMLNAAGNAWTMVGKERRNAVYGVMVDYFCNHRSGSTPLPEVVAVLEHRMFKSFRTGQVRGQILETYAWSCADRSLAPQPWPIIPKNVALGPTVTP